MSLAAAGPWWRRADWGALLVLGVVLASSAAGLGNGFAYDDVPIVQMNDRVSALRWPWEYFTETYWSPPWGAALYRPVTILLFALQWRVADWAAVTFHVVNVTVYAVAALLLLRLARTLVRPAIALGLAVLWVAHPVHVEVVGNVVGQSELWVLVSSLVAIDVWRRALAAQVITWRTFAGLLACVAVALGAKESGIVLPVILGAMWVADLAQRGWTAPGPPRAALLLRAMCYLVVLYLGARYAVLGSLGGDVAHSAIVHMPTAPRMLVALGLVLDDARLLFWPGVLRADYSPPSFAIHPAWGLAHVLALLLVLGAVLSLRALHRARCAAWPAVWGGLALLPTSNLLFATGVVLAERSLFVPSVGIALLVGQLVDLVLDRFGAQIRPGVRRLALAGVAVVAVLWGRASAERQGVWADSPTLIASSVVEDRGNPRWQRVLGVHFLRLREWDRAEAHFRAAAALASGDFHVVFGMVRVLERQGRCVEALEWYARLLNEFPPTTRAYMGQVACQLMVRRFREARRNAIGARAGGFDPAPFAILVALADSMLRATDSLPSGVGPGVVRDAEEPLRLEIDDAGRLTRRDPVQARLVVPPGGKAQ